MGVRIRWRGECSHADMVIAKEHRLAARWRCAKLRSGLLSMRAAMSHIIVEDEEGTEVTAALLNVVHNGLHNAWAGTFSNAIPTAVSSEVSSQIIRFLVF